MSRILLRKFVRQIKGVKYVSTWSPLATAFNSKATPDLDLNNKTKATVSTFCFFFVEIFTMKLSILIIVIIT